MQLPEVGSIAAVQYKRNPHKSQDPTLNPRLLFGRVLRHEGSWGFTAAFTNYDSVPQETWLEFDNEDQRWDDRNFQQPVEAVLFPVPPEFEALHSELENLPAELPQPEDGVRPFSEMRLRFLLGAAEAGWLKAAEPVVIYSDDYPDARSASASWHRQRLSRVEISEDRIFFEWPIDDKDPAECGIELARQDDGTFHAKSEEFGDEFHARFEQREGAQVLIGLWSAEEFLSFFAAVFPNS
ncbi:MAG: hypothetical protein HY821_13370 [Acidobacteria bacterium]|nr:hypothetical protein [Acidobacteriota bacterium]